MKQAVIIGAGYGGLALANLLAKSGYKVDVYEKNSAPGGRIQAIKKDGFLFDLGPSWYLMPEVFEQYYGLFNESAKEKLDIVRFSPGYKVFLENQPAVEVIGDVKQDKHLFESIEKGAGEKLEKYVKNSSLAYNIAVKYFLYNNFNNLTSVLKLPIIKAAPQMLSLVFKNLDSHVSSYFNDLRLKQMLEYHMVFLGSSPFQAPGIYTLMSHLDFKSGVFYPKKGMLTLATDMLRIGQNLNVNYHFNSPVSKIISKNGQATGIQIGEKIIPADIVISNADLHFTETKLLDAKDQSYPESYWQKRQPGPGSLLISLGIKGKLTNLKHHNLYFVDDWRENFASIYEDKKVPKNASIYVCNPTKTDPNLAPKGHENIFILMPIPSGVSLNKQQQNELLERSISILEKMTGVKDIKSRVVAKHLFTPDDMGSVFNSWQFNAFGGESHLLKQSVIFRTGNKSKKLNNLFYVGAGTLPGIGLPMCLISAEQTYKKITGLKTAGPLKKEEL